MISHPDYERLLQAMGRAEITQHLRPWAGVIFRGATPDYATRRNLVSGTGAFLGGGRWNYPGMARVVYTCTHPETTIPEYLAYTRYMGIPDTQALPVIVKAIEVKFHVTLNIAEAAVMKALDRNIHELTQQRWQDEQNLGREALTQAIGRAAFMTGIEGIFVPTDYGAEKECNLIIFPGNLKPASAIKVLVKRRPK